MNNINYPSYEEIAEYVRSDNKFNENFMQYTTDNHKQINEIFDILTSDTLDAEKINVIKMIGHMLNDEGGFPKMQSCYYMLIVAIRIILKKII